MYTEISNNKAGRKVALSKKFVATVRKYLKKFNTVEDAAESMGFARWQTLSELLNRGSCRQATLDKINEALEAAKNKANEQSEA